jgi:hypothetical protein
MLLINIPSIIFFIIPFVYQENIEGIEEIKEIPVSSYPIVIFYLILTWLPLMIQIVLGDPTVYVDIALLVGSLFFGFSIHYFEKSDAIFSVAYSEDKKQYFTKLRMIGGKMMLSAMFCSLGGVILLFCGIIFRYDLSGFGSEFSIYMFERMFTVFGGCAFLWGALQASSLSRWHELKDHYPEELQTEEEPTPPPWRKPAEEQRRTMSEIIRRRTTREPR